MTAQEIEAYRRELAVWCEKYAKEFTRKIPKKQRIEYMEYKINSLVSPITFKTDLEKQEA